MSEVWFTADTHFNHKAMVEQQWRPFGSLEDMNEHLIQEWNGCVHPTDQVWHLGDVGLGNEADLLTLVTTRLHGVKHLIAGNHDPVWSGNRDAHKHMPAWLECFQSIQPFARRRIAGQNVLLSHFPYQNGGDHTEQDRFDQYRLPNRGLPLLCGHVHTEWEIRGNQCNVGVDQWGWKPVPLSVIETWLTE